MMFRYMALISLSSDRLNLDHPYLEDGCRMRPDMMIKFDPKKPMGEAFLDYCVQAGIGAGSNGRSAFDVIDSLIFAVHDGAGGKVTLSHDEYFHETGIVGIGPIFVYQPVDVVLSDQFDAETDNDEPADEPYVADVVVSDPFEAETDNDEA